jgi:hypothetical protein
MLAAASGEVRRGASMEGIIKCVEEYKRGRIGSLQQRVTTAIINSFPPSLSSLFVRRLEEFCPWFPPPANVADEFIRSLEGCQPLVRVACFKTLINSWTTSYRYHERELLPCIFGCRMVYGEDEPQVPPNRMHPLVDDVSHYLQCPTLWGIVGRVFPLPIGHSIAKRLGVAGPPFSPVALAMSYIIYHSLKQGNRPLINRAIQSGDFTELLKAAGEIATLQIFYFLSSSISFI